MRNTIPFPARADGQPLCMAHAGARAYAIDNSLDGFRIAAELGAEMWEIDIRITKDNVLVVAHDADLKRVYGQEGVILEMTVAELKEKVPVIPTLDEVISLAQDLDCSLYLDVKAEKIGNRIVEQLLSRDFTAAAIGSFSPETVRELVDANCPFAVAVLVRLNSDPFEIAAVSGADVIHLCWERAGDRPQDLVTPGLIAEAQKLGLGIVIWHEERPDVLRDLMAMPVLGICTDQPELMRGAKFTDLGAVQIVCHRGGNRYAPENTLAAARVSFDQSCHFVEVDVRETSDRELVVIHDAMLDRTTNGRGLVRAHTLEQVRELSAGTWFSEQYADEKVPTLREMIVLCQRYGAQLYIENKDADPAKILALVDEMGFGQNCFHWSADGQLHRRLRELSPDARLMSRRLDYDSLQAAFNDLAPTIIELDLPDYVQLADEVEALGATPMLRYFGADPAIFAQIAELAPRMVNLDRADMLLTASRTKAGRHR